MTKALLEIRNLTKFYSKNDKMPAVCDTSLVINQNKSLALIGESGCGKTTEVRSQLVRLGGRTITVNPMRRMTLYL